jgi:uncharacterized membrane-anchored protein
MGGLARFKRFHHQEDLAAGEKLLRYNAGYFCAISIAPNSFMFQEGQAKFYQQAKYGIFKLGNKANNVLIGLADDKFQIIKP